MYLNYNRAFERLSTMKRTNLQSLALLDDRASIRAQTRSSHRLENLLDVRIASGEGLTPEGIFRILDQLNERNQQTPLQERKINGIVHEDTNHFHKNNLPDEDDEQSISRTIPA